MISDFVKQMEINGPDVCSVDIISHLEYRIRNNQLGATIYASPADFPALDFPASLVCAASSKSSIDEEPVKRPPTPNSKAGTSLMDFGRSNGIDIVTLGQDGKCILIGDGSAD